MRGKGQIIRFGVAIVTLLVLTSQSEATRLALHTPTEESKYKTPEDMMTMIPGLGHIPHLFIFGRGTTFQFNGRELQVRHLAPVPSKSAATPKNCFIGLRYTTPVTGFISSQLDIPLFHAETLALADWSRSTMGDYSLSLSQRPQGPTGVRLIASARF